MISFRVLFSNTGARAFESAVPPRYTCCRYQAARRRHIHRCEVELTSAFIRAMGWGRAGTLFDQAGSTRQFQFYSVNDFTRADPRLPARIIPGRHWVKRLASDDPGLPGKKPRESDVRG